MARSPLSGAFAKTSGTTKQKTSKNGAILLISGIALATSIGGVFAANTIGINGNDSIEFGQGAATTTTCDTGAMEAVVTQQFSTPGSESTTDVFRVSEVVVRSIDAACEGVDIRLALIGSANEEISSTKFSITTGQTEVTWAVANTITIDANTVSRVAITTSETVLD
jgi:hypothetical protein